METQTRCYKWKLHRVTRCILFFDPVSFEPGRRYCRWLNQNYEPWQRSTNH